MAFSPVVTSSILSEYKIVRSEELTKRSRSHRIHCPGFKVHKDGSRDVSASSGFIEIDVYPFKLKVRVPVVSASGIDSMLV